MIDFRQIARLNIAKELIVKHSKVSAQELANQLSVSNRVVTHLAAGTVNRDSHANGKINLLSLLAGFDTTLPAATGSGDSYFFRIGIVNTSNDYGILAAGTDTLTGSIQIIDTDTSDNCVGFAIDGTDDKIEINGTTKGGLTIGDWVKFEDLASTTWTVSGVLTGSGTIVTPAAAT